MGKAKLGAAGIHAVLLGRLNVQESWYRAYEVKGNSFNSWWGCKLRSTNYRMERETGIEPATFSLGTGTVFALILMNTALSDDFCQNV